MASNIIKDLEIDLGSLNDQIIEAINETLENLDLQGLGDDGNTEFSVENVEVRLVDGKFLANIYLHRESGKFMSNGDLEEAVLYQVNREKIAVTVEIGA